VVAIADLAGDVAEAGSGEPWGVLGDYDVSAVDGAQVEFLVEGPEAGPSPARGPPPRLEPKVLRRYAPAAGVRTRRAEGPRLHQSGQAAGERVGGDGDEQDGEGGAEPGRVDPGGEAVARQRTGQRGGGERAEQRPVEGDRSA
jgi:hypothetical protein